MRQAKAWAVKPTWSDEHDYAWAPTASKARYRFLLEIGDSYPDLKVHEIVARRAVHQDRWLPDEHRLVAELSVEDKAVILGAYGASNYRRPGYRDHFCTSPGDSRLHRLAWELGLFRGPYGERAYGETPNWSGAFYYLTDLGKLVAQSMMPTYR